MEAFTREAMSVAMEGDGLEIRLEEAGEMTVGFFRHGHRDTPPKRWRMSSMSTSRPRTS